MWELTDKADKVPKVMAKLTDELKLYSCRLEKIEFFTNRIEEKVNECVRENLVIAKDNLA